MKNIIYGMLFILFITDTVYGNPFRETPEAQQEEVFIQYKQKDQVKDIHVGFGLEVWQAYWEPVWRSFFRYEAALTYLDPAYLPVNYGTYRVDPLFHYLPYFSMRFNNMGFKLNAAYGKTRAKMETVYYLPTFGHLGTVKYDRSIEHYDAEVLYTLHLKKYLTFYAGPKGRVYDIKEDVQVINVSALTGVPLNTPDLFIYQAGMTAGISLKLYFAKLFNLEARGAGIVLWGEEKYSTPFTGPGRTFAYGFDSTAFFNCRIPLIYATLSLGFRYQYMLFQDKGNYSYRSNYDRSYGSSVALKFYF